MQGVASSAAYSVPEFELVHRLEFLDEGTRFVEFHGLLFEGVCDVDDDVSVDNVLEDSGALLVPLVHGLLHLGVGASAEFEVNLALQVAPGLVYRLELEQSRVQGGADGVLAFPEFPGALYIGWPLVVDVVQESGVELVTVCVF